ncbi:glycosyltransferase [Microbacterium sp. SD291]|uniref:glycosyltransferase n=1 Tax=Microbacterium sp. SD291 TaxID=2782007 RepID=UPI001A9719BF|nr:glycosyltransferase [Microbacterium sp. SD291]MBO0980990.1 glycosyltransferase [Microbacterium sp. SD291]
MAGVIAHEWAERFGGAENVLDRFMALYPDAPVVALWNDAPERFDPSRVSETWLGRTPLRRHKALSVPLQLPTWRLLGRSDADWVLSIGHMFAHHARFRGPARDAPTFSYVHTPARWIWSRELDMRGRGLAVRAASPALQRIDRTRAQAVGSIVGNSVAVRDRIRRHWGVDAGVIHPPVEVRAFSTEPPVDAGDAAAMQRLPSEYMFGASRFVPYKRLDLVIRAGRTTGLPVVLAGSGPERENLKRLAEELGVRLTVVDTPSHALLVQLYRRSIAYLFPAVEDFGIMPVEAMATGTPVIGRTIGGVTETVLDGVSGALIDDFEGDELRTAIDRVSTLDRSAVAARAWEFDVEVFDRRIREWLPAGS